MYGEDGREAGKENTIIGYTDKNDIITGRFSGKENLSVIFIFILSIYIVFKFTEF